MKLGIAAALAIAITWQLLDRVTRKNLSADFSLTRPAASVP